MSAPSTSAGADYSAFLNFVQAGGAAATARDDTAYATLSQFVQVADAGPADAAAPDDAVHAGLAGKGQADDVAVLSDFVSTADAAPVGDGAAPNDAVHAGLAGQAKGEDSAVLTDFVRADNASGAPPEDAIHARLLSPAATSTGDVAALRNFVAKPADEAKPILVAAATVKPKPVKTAEAADDSPATYVGSQACVRCHRDQVGTFGQTLHGDIFLKHPRSDDEKLGCEACHGPGSKHAKTKETDGGAPGDIISFRKDSPRPIEERNAICLGCHERADRTYWKGSAHETQGLACTSCHQVMEKVSPKNQMIKSTEAEVCFQCHKDRRAQFERPSHHPLREGDMTCSSCHNPHGSATDKLLRGASINETCYKCHADKRGPFLWEHEPVRESCLNCHEPHGTVNEYLLKVQRPRLCQLCHMGPGHGNPGNPMTVQSVNRSCQNCHTKVHGSNSPAGSLFQR